MLKGSKYILCAAVCTAMLTACINTAFAEQSVSAVFDAGSGKIEVAGQAEPKERVTIKVINREDCPGGDINGAEAEDIAYFDHMYTDGEGNFKFDFRIDGSRKNGGYLVFVSSDGVSVSECEFILIDSALIDEMLSELNKAAASDVSSLAENGIFTVFGTDQNKVDRYYEAEQSYRDAANASWIAVRPENGYTSAAQANDSFYAACSFAELKALVPGEDNRAEIENGIKNVFDGLGEGAVWEKYTGSNAQNILNTEAKEKIYKDALEFLKTSENAGQFTESVTNAMILNSINSSTSWIGYKNLITLSVSSGGFSEYISGVNLSGIDETVMTSAFKNVYNSKTTDYEDLNVFIRDINNALSSASGSAPSGGGSSSGNGGGGGGGGSSSGGGYSNSGANVPGVSIPADKPVTQDQTKTPAENNGTFNDMDNYGWAETAVEALAAKGILNGMGDGSFAPGANVTREQFVKILAEAFDIDINGGAEADFEDCEVSDWSYPYIAAAYELGFVKGDNGKFGKIQNIKREDAALMLYRFMGMDSGSGEGPGFADIDDISDYAFDAVSAMAAEDIINGNEKNEFMPKSFMTRAEAAQIVYNAIKDVD